MQQHLKLVLVDIGYSFYLSTSETAIFRGYNLPVPQINLSVPTPQRGTQLLIRLTAVILVAQGHIPHFPTAATGLIIG